MSTEDFSLELTFLKFLPFIKQQKNFDKIITINSYSEKFGHGIFVSGVKSLIIIMNNQLSQSTSHDHKKFSSNNCSENLLNDA